MEEQIMNKNKLVNDSIDYMIQHFDENISVGDVADYFHFSKYYFCRVFKEVTGESIYAFIKRLKMDQSAVDIKLEKNKMITDIGLDYGYSSSNYSSAFKEHHHISPVEFRKAVNVTSVFNPFYPRGQENFKAFNEYDSRIKIQRLDDILVIYERFIGNYIELKERWYLFMDQYKDYFQADTIMIERFYNDPMITNLNQCICDLCMTVNVNTNTDHMTIIRGGKFASYCYEGRIQDIFGTLQGIFSIWLPKSGYVMNERYGLNIYRKIDRNSESVIMDLCIPIK
jgi:AraC family transcriptional regulator